MGDDDSTLEKLVGGLDDVAAYSGVALSADQVANHYAERAAVQRAVLEVAVETSRVVAVDVEMERTEGL